MYTCANCKAGQCLEKDKNPDKYPKNCPMADGEYMDEILSEYDDPELSRFYYATKTSREEGTANSFVPRLRYVIDLCKHMGYKRLGLAFCVGFQREADMYSKLLRRHGFEVVSVGCCNGGFNLSEHGVPLPTDCDFDAACNPIGQAKLINSQHCDFNLVMGLCAGHDSLFMRFSEAMCTVICVKDPATGHCPPMALYLYDSYYKEIFEKGMVK